MGIWCVNTYIEVVKSVGDPADPSDKLERLSESEPSEQSSNGLPGVGYFPPEGKCKMSLRVCGPKLSTFLVLVSVWGLIQLTIMGLSLHKRDVQYIEDIDLEQEYNIICLEKCKAQQPDGNCKKDAESCLEDCKRDCKEGKKDPDNLFTAMERAYDKGANNCFVAALLYLVTLVVSGHQMWLNNRVPANSYQRYR